MRLQKTTLPVTSCPCLPALLFTLSVSYSLSSNYNCPSGFGSGYDAIQAAVQRLDSQEIMYSELERDLIFALASRSSSEAKAAIDPEAMFFGEMVVMEERDLVDGVRKKRVQKAAVTSVVLTVTDERLVCYIYIALLISTPLILEDQRGGGLD